MNEAPLEHWLTRLGQQRPELALAAPYLAPADRDACMALTCLLAEFADAVHGIEEPTVAQSKLAWWVEECGEAAEGRARHPLTQAVFAHPRARSLAGACWQSAVSAGRTLREAAPASDIAAQIDALEPFHGRLADIEQRFWRGAEEEASPRARRLAVLAHLHRCAWLADRTGPVAVDAVPMQLLARHGLNRDQLEADGDSQRRLAVDQLRAIEQAIVGAGKMPGSANLFVALTAHADRRALRRALRASEPRQGLGATRKRAGLACAMFAWRHVRRNPSSLPKQISP